MKPDGLAAIPELRGRKGAIAKTLSNISGLTLEDPLSERMRPLRELACKLKPKSLSNLLAE